MAPGGYTASALKYNPTAKAIGITLPPDKGGHEVFLNSYRSTVLYHDITMFAKEFGVEEVPCTHPEHDSFSLERPFINQRFDFVICDGQSYEHTSDPNTGSEPKQTDSQAHS